MEYSKIERIENEIKDLHYNPKTAKHSFSDIETKELYKWFWDIHVKPVIEYSKAMATKYGADLEAVWLAAILHDIARLDDEEPHDEIGSQIAYDFLIKNNFPEVLVDKVKNIILSHRCRNYSPQTLEQKIVASADSIAHFLQPFYIWIGKYSNQAFADMLKKDLNKIERDYNEKIFFTDEKQMVEKQYLVLKNWFIGSK